MTKKANEPTPKTYVERSAYSKNVSISSSSHKLSILASNRLQVRKKM
jgi:hypothetical protein